MQWKLSPLKCLFFLKCLLPLEGFYIARLLSTIDLCFFGRLQCVCSITLPPNCRVITIGTSLCVITGPVNSFELNNLKEWKNKHVFFAGKSSPRLIEVQATPNCNPKAIPPTVAITARQNDHLEIVLE